MRRVVAPGFGDPVRQDGGALGERPFERREHQKQQRGQRHRPPPARPACLQGQHFSGRHHEMVFRRQVRFQNRSRRRRQPQPVPVDEVTRFPIRRELALEGVQALEVVNAVQTREQEPADVGDGGCLGGLIRPGQRRQPQAHSLRALFGERLRGGDDQEIHDAM